MLLQPCNLRILTTSEVSRQTSCNSLTATPPLPCLALLGVCVHQNPRMVNSTATTLAICANSTPCKLSRSGGCWLLCNIPAQTHPRPVVSCTCVDECFETSHAIQCKIGSTCTPMSQGAMVARWGWVKKQPLVGAHSAVYSCGGGGASGRTQWRCDTAHTVCKRTLTWHIKSTPSTPCGVAITVWEWCARRGGCVGFCIRT